MKFPAPQNRLGPTQRTNKAPLVKRGPHTHTTAMPTPADATKPAPDVVTTEASAPSKAASVTSAPDAPPKPGKPSVVPFARLFSFATTLDKVFIIIGAVAAAINGCIFPLFTLVFARVLDELGAPGSSFSATISTFSLYFLLIALGAAVTGWLETTLPSIAAERQMRQVRSRYVRALLRQDAAWHDTNRTGEAASRLAEETVLWQGGIGDKMTGAIKFSMTFIAGPWRVAVCKERAVQPGGVEAVTF